MTVSPFTKAPHRAIELKQFACGYWRARISCCEGLPFIMTGYGTRSEVLQAIADQVGGGLPVIMVGEPSGEGGRAA